MRIPKHHAEPSLNFYKDVFVSRSILICFAIAYGLINATSLLLVRSSLSGLPDGSTTGDLLRHPPARLLIGLALYVVSFVAFMASTKFYPVTIVFPLLAGVAYAM